MMCKSINSVKLSWVAQLLLEMNPISVAQEKWESFPDVGGTEINSRYQEIDDSPISENDFPGNNSRYSDISKCCAKCEHLFIE